MSSLEFVIVMLVGWNVILTWGFLASSAQDLRMFRQQREINQIVFDRFSGILRLLGVPEIEDDEALEKRAAKAQETAAELRAYFGGRAKEEREGR